jgi:hypothetical protein
VKVRSSGGLFSINRCTIVTLSQNDDFWTKASSLLASRIAPIVALAVCLYAAGCGSGPRTYPVAGRVTMNGQPLTSGSVQFVAVDGANYEPVGDIGTDGTYRLVTLEKEGAPLGKYKVLVRSVTPSNPSDPYSIPKSTIPKKYSQAEETDLVMEVVSSPAPNAYDIVLTQ